MKTIIKFAYICLVVSFLGMSTTYASSNGKRILATGSFRCSVNVVDPPVGTGIPRASALISFDQTLGIIGGPVSGGIAIGTGIGLEATCQALAERISDFAQNQRCTVSAIQNIQFVGGNFTDKTWSFDILCNGGQSRVVNSISNMLEEIMTAPDVAQQTIQEKSNEMRESNENLLRPLQN